MIRFIFSFLLALIFFSNCNNSAKLYEIEYGDSNYMTVDSTAIGLSYYFKDSLPDGSYLAFDYDTVYSIFDSSSHDIQIRRFTRALATYENGIRHGEWYEWIYDNLQDTVFISQKTLFDNNHFSYQVVYHPYSNDTFMLNLYPNSSLKASDWNIYKEYSEDRISITQRIDSNNILGRTVDRNGELISFSERYFTYDSVHIAEYDKHGNLIFRQVFLKSFDMDSTLLIEYDSDNKIVFNGLIKF